MKINSLIPWGLSDIVSFMLQSTNFRLHFYVIILFPQFLDFVAFEMNNPPVGKQCSIGDILVSQDVFFLFGIPVYELVIHPLFQNYIPTTLKKIGIGILVNIASVACVLALEIYIHEGPYHPPKDQCILFEPNTTDSNAKISSAYVIIPVTLENIAELLVFIASMLKLIKTYVGYSLVFSPMLLAYEFIFAQSPYSMRSMLVGTFYTIQGLFSMVSLLIGVTVAFGYTSSWKASCGTVYTSVAIFFGVIGLIVYTMAAKRYRRRLRDEHIDQHFIVEKYFTAD